MIRPRLRGAEPRSPCDEGGDGFLLLFTLANAGGVVAYAPLLTLLLPARIATLAAGSQVEWLAAVMFAGALAASAGNILFGWLSDLSGSRRGWAAAGLCLTLASYWLLYGAVTLPAIVIAVSLYQLALNMLLAPVAAWAADTVPDRRKGLLAGLLGAGPVLGALAGVAATLPSLPGIALRLAVVCALVLILTLPLLLWGAPIRSDGRTVSPAAVRTPTATRTDFALVWLVRLIVQVAGSVLFGFMFYYFQSLPKPPSEARIAELSALALLIAFPLGLAFGSVSDRLRRRRPFLLAALLIAAFGLQIMAWSSALVPSAVGYLLFGSGSGVFLALHSGYAMQLLPSPAHHGRDLGVMNLTNTLPALLAPLLTLWLVPRQGYATLFTLLAGSFLLAGVLLLFVRNDRPAFDGDPARRS